MTLADVKNQKNYRVVNLLEGGIGAEQLAEMGFLPGTVIQRVGQAPVGDPVIFQIRGLRLAMRRSDARFVAVEPA